MSQQQKMSSSDMDLDERFPATTSALLSRLRQVKDTQPKAVKSNVHLYPPSIYASEESSKATAGSSKLPVRRITSWKMTEYMYRHSDNPFPTLARGLFTEVVEDGEGMPEEAIEVSGDWQADAPRERIIARGYDKFFNIDEVEWTNWEHMERHSEPPYYLTLKSNGCLILISALSPTHLLVASKHALGTTTETAEDPTNGEDERSINAGLSRLSLDQNPRVKGKSKAEVVQEISVAQEDDASSQAHAEVGRKWLRRTLHASGKTEAELAARLWQANITAVFELCDDSFEEHVIATPEHLTGLILHGLNHNTPHFATLTPQEVSSFAKDFGFIPTRYIELPTLPEVRRYTQQVEQSGTWEGEQIEGFVIRSTVRDGGGAGRPPYRPGAPYFFKVKFEEPYLLYRQWREITRVMLPLRDIPSKPAIGQPVQDRDRTTQKGKSKANNAEDNPEEAIWKKVRSRIKRPEVALYADWAGRMMRSDSSLFDDYDRGIVRVRDRFLAWTEGEGAREWQAAKAGRYVLKGGRQGNMRSSDGPPSRQVNGSALVHSDARPEDKPRKWIVVPIAVPGCGKTLIGVALTKLFGFGHTQSDDVTTKRSAPTFLRNIAALLTQKDVVYADRNNHIEKHYNELRALGTTDKSLWKYNVGMIGIVWDAKAGPYHRYLRICSERVMKRGDNHRTLRPDMSPAAEHEAVVGQFLRNWTNPDPAMFESLIRVRLEDDPRTCLAKVVDGLIPVLNLPRPSDEAIEEALHEAEAYKITGPYKQPTLPAKPPRYYGIAIEADVSELVSSVLRDVKDTSAQSLFDLLKSSKRIATSPHITLCHEEEVAEEKEQGATGGPFQTLWDTCVDLAKDGRSFKYRVTHLVWDERVMALAISTLHYVDKAGTFRLPTRIEEALHITVGTRDESIRTFEARNIVKVMRDASGGSKEVNGSILNASGDILWMAVTAYEGQGRMKGMH